jgi:hypothetical protein
MAGTPGNVRIAAVDNITFGGTDIGYTSAPFVLRRSNTFLDISNEQTFGNILSILTDSFFEADVTLQESTVENIARAWNLPQTNITSTASTKSLALNNNIAGNVAVIVTGKAGTAPDVVGVKKIRVVDMPIVQVVSTAEVSLAKSAVSELSITMKILADSTGLFGTIRDQL